MSSNERPEPDPKRPLHITAGQLLLWTSGEYSNYGISGLFRAKVDFNVPVRKSRWNEWYHDFRACAQDPTLVDELDYVEVWGGDR